MFYLKTFFVTIILLLCLNLKSQDLQINEVVSKNYNGIGSFESKTEDWIEIYNNSTDTIQLIDYFLSDDLSILNLWQFPDIEIYPDSFLIIFASEENISNPELHTNFKLKSEGEFLALSKTGNQIVDSITIPKLDADISYGRINETSSVWSILDLPSPNYSNESSNHLSFSHESGFYTESFSLNVSTLRPNHIIYYTLDGSEPNESSFVYQNSLEIEDRTFITNHLCNIPTTASDSEIEFQHIVPNKNINKATVLKITSFYDHKKTSNTINKTFFIDKNNLYDIPVVSISINESFLFDDTIGIYVPGVSWKQDSPSWSGNYTGRGENWEREIHISYFTKDKQLQFEQNAGLRIHGGLTRTKPQKSLRVYARKEYSSKSFSIPFFEGKKYNKFVLKNMYSSWNETMISDYVALKSAENLNLEAQKFTPVIVYVNGEYWGLQFLGERIDEDYLVELLNISKNDSINLLTQGSGHPQYGNPYGFKALKKFINENDLQIPSNYDYVSSKIDIDNFILYHITEMFFNNIDWPVNNIKFWNFNNTKWRYILYDLDGGTNSFGFTEEYNMFDHMLEEDGPDWPNPPTSNFIFRKLIQNETFKKKFVAKTISLLENEFSYDVLKTKFDEIIPAIKENLPEHIDRWNYPASLSEWEINVKERILDFIAKRQCIFNQQMIIALNLGETSYNCVDKEVELAFKLYPNPSRNIINIEFSSAKNHPTSFLYNIIDLNGSVVQAGIKVVMNKTEIELNTKLNGLYFLQLINEYTKPITAKLIIVQ